MTFKPQPNPEALCPACHRPLRHGIEMDGGITLHTLYCSRIGGKDACRSTAANDGATGNTLDEAMKNLKRAVEIEEDDEDENLKII